MDEYYLSKEDWDTIVKLGVGDHKDDLVLKKITPATKTAFTSEYNGECRHYRILMHFII